MVLSEVVNGETYHLLVLGHDMGVDVLLEPNCKGRLSPRRRSPGCRTAHRKTPSYGDFTVPVRGCLLLHFQPSQRNRGILPLDKTMLGGVKKLHAHGETLVAVADDDTAVFLHRIRRRLISQFN